MLCRIVRYSLSNGTTKGIARLGIGWCFGEDQTDLSCSIRNAHFADMYGPISVVSSRNGSFLLEDAEKLHQRRSRIAQTLNVPNEILRDQNL